MKHLSIDQGHEPAPEGERSDISGIVGTDIRRRVLDEEDAPAPDSPCAADRLGYASAGARVVSIDSARRPVDAPPWELVEAFLQSGKPSDRLREWQRRSPAFASALRMLCSLESHAGDPSPVAALSSRRAPSWLMRPPPARPGDDAER